MTDALNALFDMRFSFTISNNNVILGQTMFHLPNRFKVLKFYEKAIHFSLNGIKDEKMILLRKNVH